MNNVLPGFIDSLPEKPERRARIPMGRYGTVDEVAKPWRSCSRLAQMPGRTSWSTEGW